MANHDVQNMQHLLYVHGDDSNSRVCIESIHHQNKLQYFNIIDVRDIDADSVPIWMNGVPIIVDGTSKQIYKGEHALSFVIEMTTVATTPAVGGVQPQGNVVNDIASSTSFTDLSATEHKNNIIKAPLQNAKSVRFTRTFSKSDFRRKSKGEPHDENENMAL